MKIYLAGSIAGGRDFADGLLAINKILTENGHTVLTPFVVDSAVNEARFPDLDEDSRAVAIRDQDLALLRECDLAIAEVSQTSFGVGIEIGKLEFMGKPILCLRHESLFDGKMSYLIKGSRDLTFTHYSQETVGGIVNNFLKESENLEGKIRRKER